MDAQLSLLDAPALKRVRRSRAQGWYDRIRPELRRRYLGQVITADHVWILMEEKARFMIPAELHHNCMGALFETWPCALSVGHPVRSSRNNGNYLNQWKII